MSPWVSVCYMRPGPRRKRLAFRISFTRSPLAATSRRLSLRRMKFRVVTAWAVGWAFVALSFASAQTTGTKGGVRLNLDEPATATPAAKDKPAAAKTAGTTTSTATKPAPAKKDAKKTEPEPKIDGLAVARGAAGYLGVKVVDGNFRISFYGADKKPKSVDVSRAALRWPVQYQKADEHVVLQPSDDGKTLTSAKLVRPPFTFKLYITLLKDGAPGEDPAAENYVVDFTQ